MSDCLVVIPARMGSTRFPGKVLALLDGKPIVRWCYDAARAAAVGPVLVATEDARVAKVVESFGGQAAMTSADCVSGTDRVWETVKKYKNEAPFVINLQGDQPLIRPATIKAVARVLKENASADMATAVMRLCDDARAANPNVVKAVVAKNGRCLYFSRSPVPFPRDGMAPQRWEHLGIYGFKRKSLERFVTLPPSALEKVESLEQLRALEEGLSIYAAVVEDAPVAVDVPEDLRLAETLLRRTA